MQTALAQRGVGPEEIEELFRSIDVVRVVRACVSVCRCVGVLILIYQPTKGIPGMMQYAGKSHSTYAPEGVHTTRRRAGNK